jgi:hypothetical protein
MKKETEIIFNTYISIDKTVEYEDYVKFAQDLAISINESILSVADKHNLPLKLFYSNIEDTENVSESDQLYVESEDGQRFNIEFGGKDDTKDN